jgi:carbon starvation protein CstA
MTALPLILFFLAVAAIGYRYYSAFLAAKVMVLDDARVTPAHRFEDAQNYVPTNKWVLFGHHFAAISGAGPLIGPVLAAQFGYLPGLLWLAFGVVFAGAAHDFVILASSIRRNGKSLAEIARREIGRTAGLTSMIAILFIIVIALAGLGIAVVNALADSSWGTFTIFLTIPIALFVGLYLHKSKAPYAIRTGSIAGALAVLAAVVLGRFVRLHRQRAAGVDAALPARLPVLVHEARHDRRARHRHHRGRAADPRARPVVVHSRRRADHPRQALSVRLHHHRLRRDLRLPRAHRLRHDAEDG